MSESDIAALNRLAYRYAAAVDACDVEAFLDVFVRDGRLRSYHPDAEEPFAVLTGHTQLAAVPNSMRGLFRRTAHMMTNHLVQVSGNAAAGELLCAARHLSADPEDQTSLHVMIRYKDRYARQGGAWRIADRQIRFLWSERHPIIDSGFGRQ